ncbi:MAG: crossover junction endodeoxyribonuclease RuvC [Patescibacteria group bacterium]|jgi:crossover junction endodeoxyribonuclease RuvC
MSQIILGLDPGTATIGYGVIVADKADVKHIAHGCIITSKTETMPTRLNQIAKELRILLRKFQPDLVAIEQLYFAKNVTTAMTVAQARGVLIQTVANLNIPVEHYTPLQVKQALTGYGKADKTQMQKMVKALLGLADIPKPDDAADALAVAVTCAASSKLASLSKEL